jgi:peptide/nickel transport system substrate-binding protein
MLPANYLARVQALKPYAILRRPSYIYNHLDFNLLHAKVSDAAVREALRFAVDRVALRDKVGHGVGILQEVSTPASAPYAVGDVPLVPFDLAKANALLDEAGWVRGADGVRAKNGVRLSLSMAAQTGSPDVLEQIELLRSWWKQAGVDLDVRLYPPNLLFAPPASGGIVYGNTWDVIATAWVNDAIGDPVFFSCDAFPPAGRNIMRWCDPRAKAAMAALYTHYDQARRNADRVIVEHAYVRDVPSIAISAREDIYAYNRDLRGFRPNSITPFDDMMDVDI